MAETQTKAYDLQEKASALEDRLSRVVIRAPDDGMVIGMTVHTIGGVVRPATPLLDIVPSVSDLVVEAQVVSKRALSPDIIELVMMPDRPLVVRAGGCPTG